MNFRKLVNVCLIIASFFACATSRAPVTVADPSSASANDEARSRDEFTPREPDRTNRRMRADAYRAFDHADVMLISLPEDSVGYWWEVHAVFRPDLFHPEHNSETSGVVMHHRCLLTRSRPVCALPIPPGYSEYEFTMHQPEHSGNRAFIGRLLIRRGQAEPVEYRTSEYDEAFGDSVLAPTSEVLASHSSD